MLSPNWVILPSLLCEGKGDVDVDVDVVDDKETLELEVCPEAPPTSTLNGMV